MSGNTSIVRDISQLSNVAQVACKLFMEECSKQGVDIFITETYRTQERQNYLYQQGRTIAGKIVTWTKISMHTSRRAWDIACKGPNMYDKEVLKKAGKIAMELGLTWGGSWTPADMPHIQVEKTWKEPTIAVMKVQPSQENKEDEEVAEKRYDKIDEVPQWAKATVQKLIDEGKFGDKNKLDLTVDMMRILVIVNR